MDSANITLPATSALLQPARTWEETYEIYAENYLSQRLKAGNICLQSIIPFIKESPTNVICICTSHSMLFWEPREGGRSGLLQPSETVRSVTQ